MTPDELIEWQAVSIIDGWSDGNEQLARVLSMVNTIGNRIAVAMGVKPDDLEYLSHVDMLRMIQGKKPKKNKRKLVSASEAQQILSGR